jgi:hypothetical protein
MSGVLLSFQLSVPRSYRNARQRKSADQTQECMTRTAAQICTGHWRTPTYLKRIRKRANDKCWFCSGSVRMTCSRVLLHCLNERVRSARVEAWEEKDPGGVREFLANPRWERRFVKFLELSGVRRTIVDGIDEDGARVARMDE